MFYSILVAENIDSFYQYESDENIFVGTIVQVNFNGRDVLGIVVRQDLEKYYEKLKKLTKFPHTLSLKRQ